jgi:hypothetical protein
MRSQFPVGSVVIVEKVTPPSVLRIGFVDRPTNTVSPSDEHAILHGMSETDVDDHVAPESEDRYTKPPPFRSAYIREPSALIAAVRHELDPLATDGMLQDDPPSVDTTTFPL